MERICGSKEAIRCEMLRMRRQMPPEKTARLSEQCRKRLLSCREFAESGTVFLYLDCQGEVETGRLIQDCLDHRKRVAVPKVEGPRMMRFYEIGSLADVAPGYAGILEPAGGRIVVPEKGSCMILPGVAFDRKGNRLGYGGGFYDAYCHDWRDAFRIGLCYEWQVLDQLPEDPSDCPVQCLVTDRRSRYLPE